MKTNLFLIVLACILSSGFSWCQEASITKIFVGEKTIQFPIPAKGFVEIGEFKRKLLEDQVPKNNKLLACFLPFEISEKFGFESVVIKKRIMVEVLRANENIDATDADFVEMKGLIKNSFGPILNKAKDDANNHYADLKDKYGNLQMEKPIFLNNVEDTNDTYSFLTLMNINTDTGLINVLTGTIIMKVKNRIIYIYVSNIIENDESLLWVSNTIKNIRRNIKEVNS